MLPSIGTCKMSRVDDLGRYMDPMHCPTINVTMSFVNTIMFTLTSHHVHHYYSSVSLPLLLITFTIISLPHEPLIRFITFNITGTSGQTDPTSIHPH